ncbi:PglZ domain-containing protein [Ectothiorhodospira variabilis]|uniref:PglZ domain-containing protein n=1 Tax=Ectothiorhodospira variabilis TaxID=505694 RepID=UPI001EFB8E45|nr:PglZ domain-containing protein [Ectothiorhodospira variabilis]MCG5496105.1 PglZ domain-containing protein [Ectothiorhodospira variabilis]
MSIEAYIQEQVLAERLRNRTVVVVYDPELRYRRLCQGLASDATEVVDATDSSIESREQAMRALQRLGRGKLQGLLVYVPAQSPLDDEHKQIDPFSLFAACGGVFPDGDGDSFQSLCLKAKPEHADEIRRLFAEGAYPDFPVIDAVGGGVGWPNLRAQLSAESSRDILLGLMAPDSRQRQALQASDAWVSEARDLFNRTLGLKLRTRGKTLSSIADELWRFVLFSEFVFDLPEALPEALADIPRAGDGARPIIETLCETLRNDRRSQDLYIEKAKEIEEDLNLSDHCRAMSDLGKRDTFPFEERTFLQQAMLAFDGGDIERVRDILVQHERSVWTSHGESREKWYLVDAAASLAQVCDDLEQRLPEHSDTLEALVQFYVGSLREMDRLHREFEQAVSDFVWQDTRGEMTSLIQAARKCYASLAEAVQQCFMRLLKKTGWPLPGMLANTQVFDRLVAPQLKQNGHRVAYFMVDALRYELGVALEKQLADDGAIEMQPSLVQLPSVTPVGMASLLPGADDLLALDKGEAGLIPMLDGKAVGSVAQRMDAFRRRYGQRFAEMRLEDFVRNKGPEIDPETDLLVLRSVEIDSHFENHPETAPAEITHALKRIRMAVNRLIEHGFHEVVIATDHGFYMNSHAGAGDVARKPQGDWLIVHDRCALGDGSADDHHLVMETQRLGIRSNATKLAAPFTMAPYRTGLQYFHGGLSLQECVVPVIRMQLRSQEQPSVRRPSVSIRYKQGATRITTRVPVIDVGVEAADMFSIEGSYEILLEAHDKKGNVVGEARTTGPVNPATGTLTLQPGETVKVNLKMQMEFEGKFKVKALDPRTHTVYSQIDLETDYAV